MSSRRAKPRVMRKCALFAQAPPPTNLLNYDFHREHDLHDCSGKRALPKIKDLCERALCRNSAVSNQLLNACNPIMKIMVQRTISSPQNWGRALAQGRDYAKLAPVHGCPPPGTLTAACEQSCRGSCDSSLRNQNFRFHKRQSHRLPHSQLLNSQIPRGRAHRDSNSH